ncbi:hypothetical protein GRX01_18415 [Halobaculum sp. WSA2]|uniref:Uncharacterized protein n=1 Tax=Halobaculum saliterrae TaxID=2073113 RepID=A0A6B0T9S9_9EURY|nr:hypothetical protein [Halobaculum saliterrae]MXR43299.1 hypothetical protein [Halobaculum saliterrae]
MSDQRPTLTRRTALRTLAAGVVAGTAATGVTAAEEAGWTGAETPTGNTLHGVVRTVDGVYAVGGGGVVIRRTDAGWEKVLDGGPTGNGNSLYGAGVTDDRERLWFVGSSGAIGEYDVTTDGLMDHSAPNDVTNNFNDVAVRGPAGEANVYVAGDSGKIYSSFENGETGTWDAVTPGSGSNVNALDFFDDRAGHAVDGNKTVFETADGGVYERTGIADANVNFYGVDSDGVDDVWVCGGGATVFRWNGSGWRTTDLGDASLRDIEVADAGDTGLAVGGGGAVFEFDGHEWRQRDTPTGQNLKAVVRGEPDVAVGAGGTVIER